MKLCSKCKVEQPVEEFHRRSLSLDGLHPHCKTCVRIYNGSKSKRAEIHFIIDGTAHHRCSTCREVKSAIEFESNAARPHGIQSYCRKCRSVDLARRYIELREAIIAGYGGSCSCCGESRYAFLDIDHVNGGGGQHRREVGSGRKYLMGIRNQNYPDSLRVLCSNCNQGRRRAGVCPHETERAQEVS